MTFRALKAFLDLLYGKKNLQNDRIKLWWPVLYQSARLSFASIFSKHRLEAVISSLLEKLSYERHNFFLGYMKLQLSIEISVKSRHRKTVLHPPHLQTSIWYVGGVDTSRFRFPPLAWGRRTMRRSSPSCVRQSTQVLTFRHHSEVNLIDQTRMSQ